MRLTPTILDRYIFRELLLSFAAVMSFCALLLLIADIFDRFGDIIDHDASFTTAALYFLTNLPARLVQIIPMAGTLAVLFALGGLARTNEVLAMVTNGIHGLRVAVPVIVAGALVVIGTFIMNEYVVPPLSRTAQALELQMEQKNVARRYTTKDVFARGRDNMFYMARTYDARQRRLGRPTIVQLTDDRTNLVRRIDAEFAVQVKNLPEEKKSIWMVQEPRIWTFDSTGKVASYEVSETSVPLEFEEDLGKVLAQTAKAEEMNFHQMRERIKILSARQQPVFSLETDYLRKLTFPFGILLIMMIGYSYAIKARAGTLMTLFGRGVSWAIAYYLASAVFQALGRSGTVPPTVATIVPTLAFLLVAILYVERSYRWHG